MHGMGVPSISFIICFLFSLHTADSTQAATHPTMTAATITNSMYYEGIHNIISIFGVFAYPRVDTQKLQSMDVVVND